MAASYRTSVAGGTASANTAVNISVTPVTGDLFVVFAFETGDTLTAATVTDNNQGGTYTRITTATLVTGIASVWIRNNLLVGVTSTSVTYTPNSTNTAAEVVVVAVSGMGLTSSSAAKQSAVSQNNSAGAATVTFGSAALTANMTLAAIACLTNPPGMTVPAGMTQRQNVGQATPMGLEIATRDSGFTGTAVTWATNAPSNWAGIAIELNAARNGSDQGRPAVNISCAHHGIGSWTYQFIAGYPRQWVKPMTVIPALQSTAITARVRMFSNISSAPRDGLASQIVVQIQKTGANFTTITPTAITGRSNGWYDIGFSSSHTDTLGLCPVYVNAPAGTGNEGGFCPDDLILNIVSVNVYDEAFGLFPTGTVVSHASNTATAFHTSRAESANDHWKLAFLKFKTGALAGQVKQITGFTSSGGVMSFTSPGFTATPAAGDAFEIINA